MQTRALAACFSSLCLCACSTAQNAWEISTQEQWEAALMATEDIDLADGQAAANVDSTTFSSIIKTYDTKRQATSIVFEQSPLWHNWEPIANLGPANLRDAPVLVSVGPDDYWMFGRYGGAGNAANNFTPEPATLEGFDIPLQTTPWANQFNAPGGLEPGAGGYHAWQSNDMVNWVHHGSVTPGFAKWTTTAEYADGKFYIYYDFPNDQDPHLFIDDDLTDGKPGENHGLAFLDPSHGSDCAFIRDLDGKFHVIYEDWSPISANTRSWDSPLAGHAVSDDGKGDFTILDPPVDNRTNPTGRIGTYNHPHWAKEDPDRFPTNVAEYEIHEPEQEAYGDWAAISIGGQYYIFGDFDPVGGHQMSVCWFTASDINDRFTWCGNIGSGHPDPDICFAEGQFYLATQQRTDYVSPGPWVPGVEARVGVDTDNDGNIDQWTDWQEVKETYDHTPGFAKQIAKTPASIDLSELPAGFGFQFEVKLTDTTENDSKPILDNVRLEF